MQLVGLTMSGAWENLSYIVRTRGEFQFLTPSYAQITRFGKRLHVLKLFCQTTRRLKEKGVLEKDNTVSIPNLRMYPRCKLKIQL